GRVNIETEDVHEHPLIPRGTMIPTMARRARTIATATRDDELRWAARDELRLTRRKARLGEQDVDIGFEVLRHAKIVKRQREDVGVSCEQFIGQYSGKCNGFLLLRRLLLCW